jgi:sarcosine oxidase subunit beta
MTEIPGAADVVIIGGGIVGVSAAYFLAGIGGTRVVVLDRAVVGSGATGRAAGVILLQADTEAEVRLQRDSLVLHRQLCDELGTELAPHGSLFLWTSEDDAARARGLADAHRACGVPLELLDAAETAYRFPYLGVEDVVLATFSAGDPWATPLAVVQRLADAARARGAVICERCEVTGVDLESGRVSGVRTAAGTISAGAVVNAAGAWARRVGEWSGVRIPVAPRKRQVFVLDPQGTLPPDAPFIMEETRDYYCKMRPEGLAMVCGQTRGETLDPTVEWGYLDEALAPTRRRVPALRLAPVTGAWAGIRPMSPDGQPVIGPVPGVDGYVVAGGLAGQGFARGPLVGQIVSELVTTGRSQRDLAPFRPDRFGREARGR